MSPGNRFVDRVVERYEEEEERRQRAVIDAHEREHRLEHALSVEEILRRMREGEPMPAPLTPQQRMEKLRRDQLGSTAVGMAARSLGMMVPMFVLASRHQTGWMAACGVLAFASVGWGCWRIRQLLAPQPADPAPRDPQTYRG